MADLLLDDGQRNHVDVDVVHEVAVAQGLDGELVKFPASPVTAILTLQSGLLPILLKELPEPVLWMAELWPTGRAKEKLFLVSPSFLTLGHPPFGFQHALDLVHDPLRQVAESPLLGVGVLLGKEHGASAEAFVLFTLNQDKFSRVSRVMPPPRHSVKNKSARPVMGQKV